MKIYGVIMAGGGGTRFWPLSRKKLPKQFLNLTGRDVLVNETFDRLGLVTDKNDIFVITNQDYAEATQDVMRGRIAPDHILAEPEARNTAACIGYAAIKILREYGDGVMCVTPSDHYIEDEEEFARVLRRGAALAEREDCLVTIGIRPRYPATGYGYIRSVRTKEPGVCRAEEFVEKPEEEVARAYLEEGCYFWNSGMFIWKASLILSYFERLLPDLYEQIRTIGEAVGTDREAEVLKQAYPHIPKISIDYGIMERADRVWMLEGGFGWSDIGSLDALSALHKSDEDGNVVVGRGVLVDTEGVICYAKDKLVVPAYVKDLIVVESEDAILVCPKDRAQDVKKIVEALGESGWGEYL